MFKHETFLNAPITEALIDIRVTFGSEFNLDELDRLTEQFSNRFPSKETQLEHHHQVKFQDSGASTEAHTESRVRGYVLFTENREKAIQLRRDGFAFSKLKPYENWESLRDEAREHWQVYASTLRPSRMTRLAVRFINRIEIPMPLTQFEDYITTGPQLAEGIPQGLAEFFFRVIVPNPDDDQMAATITSRIERPEKDGETLPYIFDIDANRPVDLDPNHKEAWNTFERLRDYKNLIFFCSMTNKAKELFR